jgi:hypothetical protein
MTTALVLFALWIGAAGGFLAALFTKKENDNERFFPLLRSGSKPLIGTRRPSRRYCPRLQTSLSHGCQYTSRLRLRRQTRPGRCQPSRLGRLWRLGAVQWLTNKTTVTTCAPVACRPSEPPPPPPAAKPEPPPETPKFDPASLNPSAAAVYRSGQTCQVGWSPKQCTAYRVADEVRIDGKQYTRAAGLAWTPVTEVLTASREDQPAPPPKQRVARQPQPQQFDPLGEFVAVVTSPIRFAISSSARLVTGDQQNRILPAPSKPLRIRNWAAKARCTGVRAPLHL